MAAKPGRTVLLLGICVVLAGVSAHSASATPPTRTDFTTSGSVTLDAGTVCNFPIVLDATQVGTTTAFFDQDGVITQRITTGTEQDVLSANGKTLVGEPYAFTFQSHFENGVRVSFTGTGVAEKVHLPDGGLFIIAGRVDVTGAVVFSVDSGNSGNNLDAFCAALS